MPREPTTRLSAFAERVTRECEEARRHSRWGDEHAAARAVLEREVYAFVIESASDPEAVRVFMREFDQQISRADEPLGDWLDAQVSR